MTRIYTNVPSLVAQNQLQANQKDLTTRLDRLSTGLRINTGKDDPAGLIASEVLRKEIAGIEQAIDNSQRAINVISTAEGALNEVSALLLDLKGLVVETANEGALAPDEVRANQLEIDSILASVDRIANTTQFGGKRLLDGSQAYDLSSVTNTDIAGLNVYSARIPEGSQKGILVQITASAETANLTFSGSSTNASTIEVAGPKGTEVLGFQSGAAIADIVSAVNSVSNDTGVSATNIGGSQMTLDTVEFGSNSQIRVTSINGDFFSSACSTGTTLVDYGVDPSVLVNGISANADGLEVNIRTSTFDSQIFLTSSFAQQTSSSSQFYVTGGGSIYQITPEVMVQGQVNVGIDSVSSARLGNAVVGFLNTIHSGETNEVSQGNYIAAQEIVDEAINQVSTLRGRLGSVQKNVLETNINSQQVTFENVSASESAIRDADIATEVSAMTRSQILLQATQQTLGIANSLPQMALSLIQG